MPEKKTLERAQKDKQEGKAPSTQAGEFVREEMEHIREGKHGARSSKQAIAIGLSKARRAGVDLKPPAEGKSSEATRKKAETDRKAGTKSAAKKSPAKKKISAKRSQASKNALKREGRGAASHKALSKQAKSAGKRRSTGPAKKTTAKSKRASSR